MQKNKKQKLKAVPFHSSHSCCHGNIPARVSPTPQARGWCRAACCSGDGSQLAPGMNHQNQVRLKVMAAASLRGGQRRGGGRDGDAPSGTGSGLTGPRTRREAGPDSTGLDPGPTASWTQQRNPSRSSLWVCRDSELRRMTLKIRLLL